MLRSLFVAALLAAPAPLLAQDQAESGQPPQRIRNVTLTGSQACPKAAADEIVVCNRIDPNEQYRVPKALRDAAEVPAQNRSWVSRAATVDQVSRVAGGLPNTCSPVGTGGQTGCFNQYGQNYLLEKKQRAAEEAAGTTTTAPVPDDTPDE